jgi:hypothetical protein
VTRSETPREARTVDRKQQDTWVGLPQLRVIDTRTGFRVKIDCMFTATSELIGVQVSRRPARKFLVAKDVRPRELGYCVPILRILRLDGHFCNEDGRMRSVAAAGCGHL